MNPFVMETTFDLSGLRANYAMIQSTQTWGQNLSFPDVEQQHVTQKPVDYMLASPCIAADADGSFTCNNRKDSLQAPPAISNFSPPSLLSPFSLNTIAHVSRLAPYDTGSTVAGESIPRVKSARVSVGFSSSSSSPSSRSFTSSASSQSLDTRIVVQPAIVDATTVVSPDSCSFQDVEITSEIESMHRSQLAAMQQHMVEICVQLMKKFQVDSVLRFTLFCCVHLVLLLCCSVAKFGWFDILPKGSQI